MRISLIVAMDRQRAIGYQNRLPWRLSADLRRFRQLTMGHHLVLGRKTFESIGRPLPGRRMIVLSTNPDLRVPDGDRVATLDGAIALARSRGESELFIGGGAGIYAAALPLADRLCLTLVEAAVTADTFFPPFNPDDWTEVERLSHPADDDNQFPFTFLTLVRCGTLIS